MKRKILAGFAVMVMAMASYSGDLPGFVRYAPEVSQKPSDKKIESISEYRELEAILQKSAKMGNVSTALALGSLYEQEWKLKDGTVRKDIQRARNAFKIALDKGASLGAFKLAILDLSENKKESALALLEKAVILKSDKSYTVAAVAYGAVVLDDYKSDTKRLLQAASLLKPVADSAALPTADFTLAHIYNLLNMEQQANKYLTRSCGAKNAPKEIVEFCFGDNVEVFNKGRRVEKTNCPTCSIK